MATQTQIANRALSLLGEAPISEFNAHSPVAETIRVNYDLSRQALLRSHRWNFAKKRGALTQTADSPPFGFAYSFQLPSDYLRILELNGKVVGDTSSEFEIEGDQLLTNSSVANAIYVRDVTDTTLFDSLFVEAFAYKLAIDVALDITQSLTKRQAIEGAFIALALPEAVTVDAQEERPRVLYPEHSSRCGGITHYNDSTSAGSGSAGAAPPTDEDAPMGGTTAIEIRGLGFFDTSNDGDGSNLDADLLDGNHASAFATVIQGSNADTHAATTTGNPHNVTKADVGLGNANNTSDADKPVSTATQAALDLKADGGLSYAIIEHTETSGSNGGSASINSWTKLSDWTEQTDTDSLVSISSGVFTLASGNIYKVVAKHCLSLGLESVLRIRNTSDGVSHRGISQYASNSNHTPELEAEAIIDASGDAKNFEVQYYCKSNPGGTALGNAVNTGDDEIFGRIMIEVVG